MVVAIELVEQQASGREGGEWAGGMDMCLCVCAHEEERSSVPAVIFITSSTSNTGYWADLSTRHYSVVIQHSTAVTHHRTQEDTYQEHSRRRRHLTRT